MAIMALRTAKKR